MSLILMTGPAFAAEKPLNWRHVCNVWGKWGATANMEARQSGSPWMKSMPAEEFLEEGRGRLRRYEA